MFSINKLKNIKSFSIFINKRTFASETHNRNIINEQNNRNNRNNLNLKTNYNEDNKKNKTIGTRKLRPHINPFSVKDIIEIPKWDKVYDNIELPFHIDLGCGKGEMIYQRSIMDKNKNYLGVDMRDIYIEIARNVQYENEKEQQYQEPQQQEKEKELDNKKNLYYLIANINLNIKNIGLSLPKESIKEISIFFPDPWFKPSHFKRRLVNEQFVKDLFEISSKDVTIFIQTDCKELGIEMEKCFNDSNLFKQLDLDQIKWDFPKSRYSNFSDNPDKFIFQKKK